MYLSFYIYNTLCSNNVFNDLFNNYNVKGSTSAQKFFSLLAHGLAKNPNVTVNVTSMLPINSQDQKRVFWFNVNDLEDTIKFSYIPLVNINILKNILVSFYVFFDIIFKKFPSNHKNVILVDYLRLSINFSVILACKLRKVKIVVVVTDFPGLGVKKSKLGKIRDLFIFLAKYDYYVCLTDQLNIKLNTLQKPSLIIEGFTDIKLRYKENLFRNKFKEFVIVYAGGLYERYGLKALIEAFLGFSDPNLRLWLYGVGPFSQEIVNYSKIDCRIQYKGAIPNEELIGVLIRASLLINPRPTHEDFTKYSFPSKNLEFMSSGTPLLTCKLPGIPVDHLSHIFLINDESAEGIRDAFKQIFLMERHELHLFGIKAKNFALDEKNNIKQAEKIISMLKI